VIDTLNFTSPFLVAIGSFITFCLISPSSLTPQVAFVSLTLFNQLRSPMTMIGFLINSFVQTTVSNKRIKEFLVADELDQNAIERAALDRTG
jgi:ABC-type multidrug transport system fused ATPase/permease subunit